MKRRISNSGIFRVISVFAFASWMTPSIAQTSIPAPIGPQLFFDADATSLSKDLNRQIFEGDVVAIGAGAIISADRLSLNRIDDTIKAQGHVIILGESQVFTGDRLLYHLGTGDFEMTNSVMIGGDGELASRLSKQILGFTAAELAFEEARQQRLKEIEALKAEIRDQARSEATTEAEIGKDLIERYVVLLERERLVKGQENPSLARLNEDYRERFKRRREAWDRSRTLPAAKVESGKMERVYFRLEGRTIERTLTNDYLARNALWTPCRCDDDEAPAWGFTADKVEAQIGGYADLYNPVLRIKGVPILYLPYLKVPIKEERQSGFLMPTVGYEQRSGNIFSQPVYFALAKNADATLTTDIFENRGTRIGLEYRFQQRGYSGSGSESRLGSGWELRLETIRDRLWLADRAIRNELQGVYNLGLDTAFENRDQADGKYMIEDPGPSVTGDEYRRRVLADPDYWSNLGAVLDDDSYETYKNDIERYLAVPSNTWRGAYGWRGITFFAPRLSFVSSGEVTSDHRYTEELYVPDDFRDAFFGGRGAKAFSTAKARIHLDGEDFYLGLGSSFGDNYLLHDRFDGQQMPLRFKVQSRMFSLLPERSPIPMSGELSGEYIRIGDFDDEEQDDDGEESAGLGSGSWRQIRFATASPLLRNQIVQVGHFADFVVRSIEHQRLEEDHSTIKSWRTGLELNLPIDGKGKLPLLLQDEVDTSKFVHHLMDWRLRLSFRPVVVKDGPYTDEHKPTGNLAYFATDRFTGLDEDGDVPDEERMKPHQRITFATNHVWKLFSRQWQLLPAYQPTDVPSQEPSSLREKARLEILKSLDRPMGGDVPLYDEQSGQWLINRYRKVDAYYHVPLEFSANITYDLYDAAEREKQRERNGTRRDRITRLSDEIERLEARIEALKAQSPQPTAIMDELNAELSAALSERSSLNDQIEELVEPWKGPEAKVTLRHAGWVLNANMNYSIYAKTPRSVSLGLTFPTFFSTNLSIGYGLSKTIDLEKGEFTRERTRSLSIATSLIPWVTNYISLRHRNKDNLIPTYTNSYNIAYGFRYISASDCWGLDFVREKDFDEEEGEATYLLQLSVTLMGEQRALPNMASGVARHTGVENDGE